MTRERLSEFLSVHATDEKTLDIGAGSTSYATYFPNRVALNMAKSRHIDVLANAHSLPFRDASFDVILCTEVLEHLKEPQQAIDEMRRVLKDGAKLILTTRFIFPLHETPNDYYRFTKYGLRYLLRNWGVVDIEEETDTMGNIAVILQRMTFQCEFRSRLFRYAFLILARVIRRLNFIIKEEYGVYYQKVPEVNIMTSGYYVIAKKNENMQLGITKLDVGCGKNKKQGFIGLDRDKNSHADILAAAFKLPFKGSIIHEINCSHLAEHLYPDEARELFDEFYRVLEDGGRVSMLVDRDWTRRRLLTKDPEHKYRYSEKEINGMVQRFSFKKVNRRIYRIGSKLRNKIFVELRK